MIPLAAVIGAATAAGVGAEHRFPVRAERLARRLMDGMLWVLLPPIVFFNLAALELTARVGAGIGFAYLAMAITLATAYLLGTRVLRLPRTGVGALLIVSAGANTGYLGLPFTVALFGFDELPNAIAYDVLVSSVTLVTVLFSIGAAFGTAAARPLDRLIAFVTRNPVLWASAAGLLAPEALAPDWAVDASRVLVLLIVPLGFFVVGVTLASEAEEGAVKFPPVLDGPVRAAVVLKLLVPAGVMLALSALVLDVPDSYLSQAAMPSAINSILVANAYGLDRRIVSGAIVWTTAIVVVAGLVVALL